MSLLYYDENEDNSKEESIDNYKDIFNEYLDKCPTLKESLQQLFTSAGASEEKCEALMKIIFNQINKHIDKNLVKIKEKYPNITLEEAEIISSYTCEIPKREDSSFNIYKIVNNNLVSENRNLGVENISKYLYILLKSLRNLDRFYPEPGSYLYRCIGVKVNLKIDPLNEKNIPYIKGNKKTFWGFTSTSPNISLTYNFLGKKEKLKTGTVFTLAGDVWGYDISLFNVFNEKEILLEPERKIVIDDSHPPVNEIINVRCEIQKTPLVLEDICANDEITISYNIKDLKENEKKVRIFGDEFMKNNINNCQILFEGKKMELNSFFDTEGINKDILEIRLKGIQKVTDISNIFSLCESLISVPDISKWNTSCITNMSSMFKGCKSLKNLPDLSKWNTSSAKNMSNMFSDCETLTNLPDISKWNTSCVTNMSNMFKGCKSLTAFPDLSNWDISSVTNISGIFKGCKSLIILPDLSNWNISSVTNMSDMFSDCESLTTLPDISKWNTSCITNMNNLFKGCKKLTSLPDISKWCKIPSVTNMSNMFSDCGSLTALPNIANWNTSSVANMSGIFNGCKSLQNLPDLSRWMKIPSVKNISGMFSDCKSLTTLPNISNWNTSSITNMSNLFKGCKKLTSIPDISKWMKIPSVTNLSGMFCECISLTSLPDISNWNISLVNNMSSLFKGCKLLTELPDISNWNTSSVTNMDALFGGCKSIRTLPDLSKWDTSLVTNMNGIFRECSSLKDPPKISDWNTSSLKNRSGMFYGTNSLVKLPDLSNWKSTSDK